MSKRQRNRRRAQNAAREAAPPRAHVAENTKAARAVRHRETRVAKAKNRAAAAASQKSAAKRRLKQAEALEAIARSVGRLNP